MIEVAIMIPSKALTVGGIVGATTALLLSCAMSVSGKTSQGPQQKPVLATEPSPEHERLAFLEGTWARADLPDSRSVRETCSWMAGGRRHMVCRQQSGSGDTSREQMMIYSYRPNDSMFTVTVLLAGGQVWRYEGGPEGDRWILNRIGNRPDAPRRLRQVITPAGATIHFREELSENGGPWNLSDPREAFRHERVATGSVRSEVFEAIRSIYEYNRKATVRLDTIETVDRPTYTRQKLVLVASFQQQVPALLAVPKTGQRPFRLVILFHGFQGSKDAWFASGEGLVELLVQAGFAVVALDAPFHGDRGSESESRVPSEINDLRELVARWTIEHRRVLDALATRADLDTTAVGVIGASMGAWSTFALAAVDARVKVAVHAVPPASGLDNPNVTSVSPATFAGALRMPTLMLMGTKDTFYSPAEARTLFDLIPAARKELVFYESGHSLPSEWTSKAAAWFVEYLK